ncbi:MAG: MFS transporter [Dehalococcoidales bacterium]|nr:MFS transporter [Dehalococcoidales bacterium]
MINKFTSLPIFNAFYYKNFSLLLLTTVAFSVGHFMMMVALGWLVLEMTDSPFSLGTVWAARSAPFLIFGIFAGALADKVDRRRLLIITFILLAVCALVMGILISRSWIQLWHILLITFIIGLVMTFNMTARQTFVVDIVGSKDAMSALSMNAAAMRVTGIFGGVVAGLVIKLFGIDWCFYIMFISYLVGILILLFIREVTIKTIPKRQSIQKYFVEGLRIIQKNQIVLTLMIMSIICETMGFSYQVVLPIFARDILGVSAIGLGMLTMAQSVGALIGVLCLASLGDYQHKGQLILGVFLFFGIFLLLFSQSPWYLTSLVLIGVVGAVAAAFDTMQHTLLQLNVNDEQRGRAMGIWMLSIGFMPVGSIMIGAIAGIIGAQFALTINGAVIILAFIILLLSVPGLKRA